MTTNEVALLGARMPYAEATQWLAGCTAAWQDLDGWHLAPLPAEPPATSLFHAWNTDLNVLARGRVDLGHVHLAVLVEADDDRFAGLSAPLIVQIADRATTVPWMEDGRVAQLRSRTDGAQHLVFETTTLLDTGEGPLTFVRPNTATGHNSEAEHERD